jgi:hypothetical protein
MKMSGSQNASSGMSRFANPTYKRLLRVKKMSGRQNASSKMSRSANPTYKSLPPTKQVT